MSLPITAVGPLKVDMKPILTDLLWAIADPVASASIAHADSRDFFIARSSQNETVMLAQFRRTLVRERRVRRTCRIRCGEISASSMAYHRHLAALSARSLKRWIFPVAVLGSSSRNSIQRGYLKGASCAFT